ncbi:MAG TPA: cobalamin biosynthesis protein [Steroidobacteraceae bacterium]
MSNALGIWPVRREAERLAERLAEQLTATLVRPWEGEGSQKARFRAQFGEHSHWVLIMAAGIAARFVQGLLKDKHRDPAVVVLDEAGRYAIPLSGGHEAGANALAYRIANAIGAVPVVTTATEAIKPFVVGIGCRKGVHEAKIERAVRHALGLCVSGTRSEEASEHEQGTLREKLPHLRALGLLASYADDGSSSDDPALGNRGVSRAREYGGSGQPVGSPSEFSRIRELVTVDLKAGEPGLVAFSRRYGIPLRVIARHQVETRSWVTRPSEWVRQSVGLDGVCEPCALIACGRGRLIVPKTALDGVAVAVVEDDLGVAE